MTRLQMVQHALTELGHDSGEAIVAFVEARYGVKIGPQFIPIYTASLRGMQQLESARQRRGTVAASAELNPTTA